MQGGFHALDVCLSPAGHAALMRWVRGRFCLVEPAPPMRSKVTPSVAAVTLPVHQQDWVRQRPRHRRTRSAARTATLPLYDSCAVMSA